MVCPRLGAGNVLSGGGKLSEKQRLYVEGVTDSCLVCSTPDTGESSVWTYCGMADGGQNELNIRHKLVGLYFYFYLMVWIPNTLFQHHTFEKCVCIPAVNVQTAPCVCICVSVCTLFEPKTRFPACSLEQCCKSS